MNMKIILRILIVIIVATFTGCTQVFNLLNPVKEIEYLQIGRNISVTSSYNKPVLEFNSLDTPYIAGCLDGKPSVLKYNGTDWENVGSPQISSDNVWSLDFTISSNDIPFIGYVQNATWTGESIYKYEYGLWSKISTGYWIGNEYQTRNYLKADSHGNIYSISWYRQDYYTDKSRIWKYNNSSWEILTEENPVYFTEGSQFGICDDGTIYTYSKGSHYISKYSSGNWSSLGSSGLGALYYGNETRLYVDKKLGIPYCFGPDANEGLGIFRYKNSQWESISYKKSASKYGFIVTNKIGTPFLITQDYDNVYKLFKYSDSNWNILGRLNNQEIDNVLTMSISNNDEIYLLINKNNEYRVIKVISN